jgi:hypothetical protein
MLRHVPHNVGEASGKVPEKVRATVFWDVHQVLLVDFTPSGSTVNAAAYQEAQKRLKEAIWCKRPRLLTKQVLLLHDNA